MYHALVRRRVRQTFDALSAGRWADGAAGAAEDVHHVFPGDHPLGGERHSRAGVMRWFERLGRLFPGHTFEVEEIVVRGWPWSTWAVVRWRAQLVPKEGEPYMNEGTHWLRVRWGKVTHIHAYLDTQRIALACEAMARAGVEEAAAEPIRG